MGKLSVKPDRSGILKSVHNTNTFSLYTKLLGEFLSEFNVCSVHAVFNVCKHVHNPLKYDTNMPSPPGRCTKTYTTFHFYVVKRKGNVNTVNLSY